MDTTQEIYLDNSATTRVSKEAAEKALYMMTECYGNPSSLHSKGFAAEKEMTARTGDIVIGESPVELGGLAQPCEFRRRTRLETAAPQGKMLTISSALGHCFSKSPCRYD